MISYLDTAFCPFGECQDFERCPRALTEERQRSAEHWWGGPNAPIAQFSEAPSCFEAPDQATVEEIGEENA